MPPSSDSQLIRKCLKKFRIAVAQAILRNVRNTQLVSVDIQDAHHIAELCDAYSLGTLVNWLGTKYGFPAYTSFIESSCSTVAEPLESWSAIADEYPFDTAVSEQLRKHVLGEGYAFLDMHLPVRLDLIGTLYEQITASRLEIDELVRPYIEKNGNGRSVGQFYTPPWVVRYCLEQVFPKGSGTLISTIEGDAFCADGGQTADRMQFKVLDPACGSGNFLLGVLDYLSDGGMPPASRLSFAQQSIYGIEIDGRAASLCRIGILLALSDVLRSIAAESLDAAAGQIERLIASLRAHIAVSDSMLSAAQAPGGNEQHPSVCSSGDWTTSGIDSFDVVVGNPPYISFGSRNQSKQCQSLSRYLRLSYPEAAEYKIRTHSIFQDIALRYVKPGGIVCLLLPDAFLTGQYYRRLRCKLLSDAKILSITEFAGDIIGDATVGRWCVAAYTRALAGQATSLEYDVDLHSFSRTASRSTDRSGEHPPNPARSYRMPATDLVSDDCARFELVFNDIDRSLWTSLRKLPRLGSLVRGHTGMRSKVGQAAIVSSNQKDDAWRPGLCSGSSVTRHAVAWDGTWLHVEPRFLFAGGFDPEVIGGPKLLVRQTADRVVAALDDTGLYHLNNVHSFSPRLRGQDADVDLWYLDGLMNSNLWLYLYQLKSRESGRALAQIDIEMLEAMPLPDNTQRAHPEQSLVSHLARLAGALAREMSRADGCHETRRLLLTSCERSIDRLVYDLYDLTAVVVEHIEQICELSLSTSDPLPSSSEAHSFAEALASGQEPDCQSSSDAFKQLPEWISLVSTRFSRTPTSHDHNEYR